MSVKDTIKVDDDGELVRILLNGTPVFVLSRLRWAQFINHEAARLGVITSEVTGGEAL